MIKYISILRGINVGGNKKILMSDLKRIYDELGFKNIITYIQSGNVIFETDEGNTKNAAGLKIEKALKERYVFDVAVIIRTPEELKKIITNNPFIRKEVDIAKLYVTLLARLPEQENLSGIAKYDYPPDEYKIEGKDVFLYCPNGYGTSKLSNNFFEHKLKVKASTRNWNTILKLRELAEG